MLLCVSPTSDQFAQRALQFPGLINGCIIDWFLPWTVEALASVADRHMADFEWGESLSTAGNAPIQLMSEFRIRIPYHVVLSYQSYARTQQGLSSNGEVKS